MCERYSVQYVSFEPAVDKYLINSVVQPLLIPIVYVGSPQNKSCVYNNRAN